jgi:hypothetical protein
MEKLIRQWIELTMKNENLETLDDLVSCGYCADLADFIKKHFQSSIIRSWNNPRHTWIEFEGKHYDMQNPQGVLNWKKLIYFKDCPQYLLK